MCILDSKEIREVSCGVTSLTREDTDAGRLHQLSRSHCGIENRPHYRRDDTLRADRRRSKGQGAQPIAVLYNLVPGLP
jgi:hypothetical protein